MKILFVMGYKSFSIDPSDNNELGGGAEKAVIRLTEQLSKIGHNCIVSGPVKTTNYNNVLFLNHEIIPLYNLKIEADVLVIWRINGLEYFEKYIENFVINNHNVYFDLHDYIDNRLADRLKLISHLTVFCRSRYHFSRTSQLLPKTKFVVIPNGVETEMIDSIKNKYTTIQSQNKRICHATSMDRGILEMLVYSWPIIKKAIPEAEFHIYYGRLSFIHNQQLRLSLERALKQPGVIFHERVTQEEVIKEMLTSSMYFYISNHEGHEADCIALREANYCECVPIIYPHGVFSERPGYKLVKRDKLTRDTYTEAAEIIIDFMNNPEKLDTYRNKRPELTWSFIANKWMYIINKVHLVTFAFQPKYEKVQQAFDNTYIDASISSHTKWTLEQLKKTKFFSDNREIFNAKFHQGCGLWIWKPFIIYQRLLDVSEGEYVYYQDCYFGDTRGFQYNVKNVTRFMENHNIDFLPGLQEERINKDFTKQLLIDNFDLKDNFYSKKTACASPLFIKKNKRTVAIVKKWIDLCCIKDFIFTEPNPTGAQHNFDMSILNCILYENNINPIDFNSTKDQTKQYNFFLQLFTDRFDDLNVRSW